MGQAAALAVADVVEAYVQAWRRIDQISGSAFNLGGGPANAVSLLQLIAEIETVTGRAVDIGFEPWRAGDQKWFVADASRARSALGLAEARPWREGLRDLADWLMRADDGARAIETVAA